MTICKFFLQGTCRFGNTCKFEHQNPSRDHNYGSGTSVLLQGYGNKSAMNANVDTTTLIKSVINDMTSAEKGGQWLLSSYAPFKEKGPFPGFEDHSMEEIRYLFYEAMRSGALDQYKQNLQMMLQEAMMRVKALQNPSPDAINILTNIYNSSSSAPTPQSTLQSNSIFGGSNSSQAIKNTPSIFGNTLSPPPNQNLFAQPQQSNVFTGGAPVVQKPASSIFGGGNTNSSITAAPIFSGQNNSVFQNSNPFGGGGGAQQQPQSQSIFGGNKSIFSQGVQPQQQQSIFAGANTQPLPAFQNNQNIFQSNPLQQQQPQQPPPFGAQNAAVAQQSPFGVSGTQPSPFGVSGTQQSPFGGGGAQQSPFGQALNLAVNQQPVLPFAGQIGQQNQQPQLFRNVQPQQQQQPFANQQQSIFQENANQHTASIFGNMGTPAAGVLAAPVRENNNEYYSKLEELTEEELKWFDSDDLDISKIPEKPPPYEVCFKK